jgi:mRNA-degrading endonuclease RelE of RelBE toxin-antitoxin system
MTPPFEVVFTAHFKRLYGKLAERHPDFVDTCNKAVSILEADPHNVSRSYPIRKLVNVQPGEGSYRLRLGRWRFRYDIYGQEVVLQHCGLR